MIQAVDLIDCDHRDDLNEHVMLVTEYIHRRPVVDPHMNKSI